MLGGHKENIIMKILIKEKYKTNYWQDLIYVTKFIFTHTLQQWTVSGMELLIKTFSKPFGVTANDLGNYKFIYTQKIPRKLRLF